MVLEPATLTIAPWSDLPVAASETRPETEPVVWANTVLPVKRASAPSAALEKETIPVRSEDCMVGATPRLDSDETSQRDIASRMDALGGVLMAAVRQLRYSG